MKVCNIIYNEFQIYEKNYIISEPKQFITRISIDQQIEDRKSTTYTICFQAKNFQTTKENLHIHLANTKLRVYIIFTSSSSSHQYLFALHFKLPISSDNDYTDKQTHIQKPSKITHEWKNAHIPLHRLIILLYALGKQSLRCVEAKQNNTHIHTDPLVDIRNAARACAKSNLF